MRKQRNNHNTLKRLLLVCYGAIMLYLLFVRGRGVESALSYWERVLLNYNLEPFHTIRNYWDILARPEYYLEKWEAYAIYKAQATAAIVNLVGNVVMFVPLGCLLPTVWEKLRKFLMTVLAGAGIIVAIELTQLLTLRGSCDVDDLILNLCGIVVGYVLWRIVHLIRYKR